MTIYSPILFIEINHSEFIFIVGEKNEEENLKLTYKLILPIQGIVKSKISDFNLVLSTIKNNVYLIEQKLNFTFNDTILIINNFDCSFINLTGFKKLNGSQILKENITYILNSLKSNINDTEDKKNILHIFNSKFILDKKKVENLPIGLFGDFYSHELSFCLINKNDYKNLYNIFDKCNLKIKKIYLKSFIEGAFISNAYEKCDTFFQIKINENNSQIFYFENDSLKFEQNFNFGTDLIVKDISKVTSLKEHIVQRILETVISNQDISKDELIGKDLFLNENYTKIKKKLFFEIAKARIEELLEKLLIKNINFSSLNKKKQTIFLKIRDKSHLKCFEGSNLEVKYLDDISPEDQIVNIDRLVNFGWKKEAIPVANPKKSVIAKFFDALFS